VFKGRGIVLKAYDQGESDKRLALFLKERGKIYVTARGARKPKSKYMAGAQIFTYSDFVFFEKGQMLSVTQVDLIESFYPLRMDLDRFGAACCMVELCDKVIMESVGADEVLHLLLLSLMQLCKGKNPAIIQRAFEFKFYQLSGIEPAVFNCPKCGKTLESEAVFGHEGALCKNCRAGGQVPLTPSALKALQHIIELPTQHIFSFEIDPLSLEQLEAASMLFMRRNFEVTLKSMDSLK
jgi:DNA repair protein RecO (recombination protein O)